MTSAAANKHILLCGERGVGKSTLIQKLLKANALPVSGFYTERLKADTSGFHPIYIHSAGESARMYTEENLVGTCDAKVHNVRLSVFDTLGVQYLRAPGGLIVMDELGFMEARAAGFTKAVFAALDEHTPVIAAVKARTDVPFLNAVRAHENCRVYTVTAENRDALYEALLPVIEMWNQK